MSEVACTVPLSGNTGGNTAYLPESEDCRDLLVLNQHVWHPAYECDIYCWLAMGSVILERCRIEEQCFLYCEYRDCTAASQYVVYSFSSFSEARTFQQQFVAQQVLPGISPDQTRKRPIQKK